MNVGYGRKLKNPNKSLETPRMSATPFSRTIRNIVNVCVYFKIDKHSLNYSFLSCFLTIECA